MLVYRIAHKKYASELSASGVSGRWNSAGKKVIYCAESIALAFLENMVRRQGVGFNHDFKIMIIEISDKVETSLVDLKALPAGWRNFRDYSICQPLGDQWYDGRRTGVLKVPSVLLPESFNYVINTTHPDFTKIKLLDTTDLLLDERIEEILKMYGPKQ